MALLRILAGQVQVSLEGIDEQLMGHSLLREATGDVQVVDGDRFSNVAQPWPAVGDSPPQVDIFGLTLIGEVAYDVDDIASDEDRAGPSVCALQGGLEAVGQDRGFSAEAGDFGWVGDRGASVFVA